VQTGIYLVGAGTLELLLATAFALALNGRFKLRGAAFAVLLLPWALPPVVAAVAWRRFWTADNGILNGLLEAMNLIDSPASWLGSIEWARVAIILAHVWVVTPFITMILLAGLQTIPAHLYDAANVDGASTARQFRSITLPLMRPSYAVAATVASIIALAIFDEIYVLTGQAVETRSVLMQVYLTTFGALNFGQGAALALLVAVSSAFIAMVYLRVLRRAEQ
jgi:multiple sugar transport system permease protein